MSIKSVYLTSFYVTEACIGVFDCSKKWSKPLFWSMFIHRIIWCDFLTLDRKKLFSEGLNKQILRTTVIILELRAQFISIVPPRHDQPPPSPHPTPPQPLHLWRYISAKIQVHILTFEFAM